MSKRAWLFTSYPPFCTKWTKPTCLRRITRFGLPSLITISIICSKLKTVYQLTVTISDTSCLLFAFAPLIRQQTVSTRHMSSCCITTVRTSHRCYRVSFRASLLLFAWLVSARTRPHKIKPFACLYFSQNDRPFNFQWGRSGFRCWRNVEVSHMNSYSLAILRCYFKTDKFWRRQHIAPSSTSFASIHLAKHVSSLPERQLLRTERLKNNLHFSLSIPLLIGRRRRKNDAMPICRQQIRSHPRDGY